MRGWISQANRVVGALTLELTKRNAAIKAAQDLQNSGFSLGGKLVHASVMFSDIRGFTSLAESQSPNETIELLNTYYALMFDAISGHGGVVTVMMGDGLMSVFGAPMPLPDHAESAVRAAQGRGKPVVVSMGDVAGSGGYYVAMGADMYHGYHIDGPDYAELAKPFGLHGQKVEKVGELKGAIAAGLKSVKDGKTSILNVCLTH